jgi:hypothetical protein
MFWWEEGYNASQAAACTAATEVERRPRASDGDGSGFLVRSVETKVHHLQALFHPKQQWLISLDDCTRQDTRVRIWSVLTGERIREFEVQHNSGYMAVSGDGTMLAIAAVKEDTINIYEIETGDLLLELEGGRRTGFWGTISFAPGSNALVEMRSIDFVRGVSKRNVMRFWSLGFSDRRDPLGDNRTPSLWGLDPLSMGLMDLSIANTAAGSNGSKLNLDEEEVEEKLWEIEIAKGPIYTTYHPYKNTILTSSEDLRGVTSYNCQDGTSIRFSPTASQAKASGSPPSKAATAASKQQIQKQKQDQGTSASGGISNKEQWCSKVVFSSDYSMFALGRHGFCTIHSALTDEVLETVVVKDAVFPVVPLGFIDSDRLIVLRMNLDRSIFVCDWRSEPRNQLILRRFGGTTSDACVISPDKKWLVCWPHSEIEFFDLFKVQQAFYKKQSRLLRVQLVITRSLVSSNRASAAASTRKRAFVLEAPPSNSFPDRAQLSGLLIELFQQTDSLFRYIVSFL